MNRNTNKFARYALALVVLVAGLGLGLSGVAAQSDSTVLIDESVTPTNETKSIYVDVTGVDNMNASGPLDVTVRVEGLTENQTAGNGTVLGETTLSVAAGTTESYDYTLADADRDYDELRVTTEVVTAGEEDWIDSTDWGTLQQVSGGAGAGLGPAVGGLPAVAILLIVGVGYIITRED